MQLPNKRQKMADVSETGQPMQDMTNIVAPSLHQHWQHKTAPHRYCVPAHLTINVVQYCQGWHTPI